MRAASLDVLGYLVMVLIACAFLWFAHTMRLPDQKFFNHEAMIHCGRVCEVKNGGSFCVMPCPGPRCLCVLGANDVWYLDATIGDEE